jgi:LmbE family N-acetylglucosaminyl deacetylase
VQEIFWKEKFTPVKEGASLADYPGKPRTLIVISPHPDDDVLGAGGAMIAAAEEGRAVFSIYLTDGRGSPQVEPKISGDEMALRRKEEAVSALKVVGGSGGFFLQKRSGELEGEGGREAEREMRGIFDWLAPTEVFLPAPYERHRTHQKGTRISLQALRSSVFKRPEVLGYSLWGGFHGGKRRVARDITPFIRKKVDAVLAHATQIAYKGYQRGVLGKNNAEAVFWESHEVQKAAFLETFVDMSEFLERSELTIEDFIREDVDAFLRNYL